MEALIKNSPVIFKALASHDLNGIDDNRFRNKSILTEFYSLIFVTSIFYKGKPTFQNFDENILNG